MHKLLFCLLLVASTPAFGFDHRPLSKRITQRMEAGDTAGLADQALGNMIDEAEHQLHLAGHPDLAERLRFEWETYYRGSLLRSDDVGDHQPLSTWVGVWYMVLEQVLGNDALEMSHLKDIWVLNFTIPVVFRPHADETWCKEQLATHPMDVCSEEYRRHFAGTKYIKNDPFATDKYLHHAFAGVVTYWLVFGGCEAAVWGSDISLVCGLAGDAAEAAMEKWPAPKISAKIWARNNP